MKSKVLVEYRKEKLRVLLVRGKLARSLEEIVLREMPREQIVRRLRAVKGKAGRSASLLLLSRSLVLEKRFEFGGAGGAPEAWLNHHVREMLPLSLDELGYGAAVRKSAEGYHGTLLAIPLAGIREILGILDDSGLSPDDIVSSDQALRWLAPRKDQPARLILAAADGEIEALLAGPEQALGYRLLRGDASEMMEDLHYFLLESGVHPADVVFSGARQPDFEAALGAAFPGMKRIDIPGGIPPAVFGAAVLPPGYMISLLPRERKQEKEKAERKTLARDAGLLSVLLAGLALSGIFLHGARETRERARLGREFSHLRPRLEEIGRLASLAEQARAEAASNAALVRLLRELSEEAPSEIVLNELSWDESGVRLRGESPTYAGVTRMKEILGGFKFLRDARLEYARLRKKDSRDFFDFDLAAAREAVETGRANQALQRLLSSPTRESLGAARELVRMMPPPERRGGGDWMPGLVAFIESRGVKVDELAPRESRAAIRAHGRFQDWMSALCQLAAEARIFLACLKISAADSGLVFEIEAAEIKNPLPREMTGGGSV